MSNCPFNLQGKVNQPARNQTLSLCLIEVHCFQCPISVRGLSIGPVAQIRVLGVILEIPFSFTFIANPWVFFVFILNISWMRARLSLSAVTPPPWRSKPHLFVLHGSSSFVPIRLNHPQSLIQSPFWSQRNLLKHSHTVSSVLKMVQKFSIIHWIKVTSVSLPESSAESGPVPLCFLCQLHWLF